jgi:hypothetical protein
MAATGIYKGREPLRLAKDLEQGDLLLNVLVPVPATRSAFHHRKGPKCDPLEKLPTIAEDAGHVRVMVSVTRWKAIVLSNSCDIAGGQLPILVAPVRAFQFRAPDSQDAERWRQINDAATGTTSTKSFYLPAHPPTAHERSVAYLAEAFPLTHAYVDRCINESGVTRMCGLKPEAQRHLQWALGLMFSRNPREDYEWPSHEDLKLKRSWLEREIERGGARHDDHKADLATVTKILAEIEQPAADLSTTEAPPSAE